MSTSQGSPPRELSTTVRQQCSGRWPGVWIDAERDRADLDLVAVAHRVVRIVDAGVGVHADRDAVLEREPAVPRDVVGVRVRLDRAHDPEAAPLGLLEHRLDRVRRIDDDGDAGLLVTDEVTRAAQVVVQELVEDHGATVAPGPAIDLEVISGGAGAGRRGWPRSTTIPATAAATAPQGRSLRGSRARGRKHGQVGLPVHRGAVVVGLTRREAIGAGAGRARRPAAGT